MEQPFILMIAGPNGSGKTTLTNWLRQQDVDFGEYINPDDIAAKLSGSYEERTREAQQVADQLRETCIAAKRSFSFETVMSHPSKVDILARAREAGFFVQLFFVGTDDPKTNIERVALRVAQGGHDVPEQRIVSRWQRAMEQLSDAVRAADQAFIFDNSIVGTVETIPRLVFRRSFTKERNLPLSGQSHPVPVWVRQYVLAPLGIGFSSVYPRLVQPLPLISLPISQTTRRQELPPLPAPLTRSHRDSYEAEMTTLGPLPTAREPTADRGLQSLSSALVSSLEVAAQAYVRDGTAPGLITGFTDLDRMIGGLQPSSLLVLTGRPGMGKTSLATNIAYNVANAWSGIINDEGRFERRSGGIVGLFSLEMSAEQIATRIISARSEIPTQKISRGEFAVEEFDQIVEAAREMEAMQLYIDDTGGVSAIELAARARRQLQQRGLDLLVVDTVQALQNATSRIGSASASKMTSIAASLKSLAKELNISIIAVAQSTKAKGNREQRPLLIEVDAALEQDADILLIVNREEQELRAREPTVGTYDHLNWQDQMVHAYGKAELIIRKNRHGPTGSVQLDFDAQVGRFKDLA